MNNEFISPDEQNSSENPWDSVAGLAGHFQKEDSNLPSFDVDNWTKRVSAIMRAEERGEETDETEMQTLLEEFSTQAKAKNINFRNSDVLLKFTSLGVALSELIELGADVTDFNPVNIRDSVLSGDGALSRYGGLRYIEENSLIDDEFKEKFNINTYISKSSYELFGTYGDDFSDEAKISNIIGDLAVCTKMGGNVVNEKTIGVIGSCMDNEFSNHHFTEEQFAELIAKPFIEKGILNSANLSNIYRYELEDEYAGKGVSFLISKSAKEGLKPEDDDLEVQYWSDLSSIKQIDAINDFRHADMNEREQEYNLDDFYAAKRCIDDETSYYEMMTNKWQKRLSNPHIQDLILAKGDEISKKQGDDYLHKDYRERGAWRALFANRGILTDMSHRIDLGQYDALCENIPEFQKLKDGDFTEKDRLTLFVDTYYKKELSDECFSDYGEPTLEFFRKINRCKNLIRDRVLDTKEINAIHSAHILSLSSNHLILGNDEKYFDNETGGLKPEFWQDSFNAKDLNFLNSLSKEDLGRTGLLESQISILSNLKQYKQSRILNDLEIQELQEKYFDESGNLKPEFWQESFKHRDLDFLYSLSDDDLNKYFPDEKHRRVIKITQSLPESKDYLFDHFEELSMKNIESFEKICNRINRSNSYELAFRPINITSELIQDSPEKIDQKIDQIESVFLKNNLPYVGKVFKTFEIAFLNTPNVDGIINRGDLENRETNGLRGKKAILWNDLLKTAIGSGNRDLKKYVDSLSRGEEILAKISHGDELDNNERESLKVYVSHLAALFNQTERGKEQPFELSGDWASDAWNVSQKLSVTERHNMPDRVARSFGFGLGISSLADLRERLESSTRDADRRNRERAEKGDFRLVSGDILKATDVEYLGSILRNGSVSKEFLNGQTDSDCTPLDTDVNVIADDTLDGSISAAVDWKNRIAAFGAMHCLVALKSDAETGRNRFKKEGEGGYDPDKYEIWQNSGNNQGIRVGFPSSEIDFLIHDRQGKIDTHGDLERMKFEVARNGFYIPIVDKDSGQCVFMSDEYDALRRSFGGIPEYETGAFEFASQDEMLSPELHFGEKTIPSISSLIGSLDGNEEEVGRKRNAILNEAIKPAFAELGLEYRDKIDGDITPGSAQFIDTGSTGRGDNVPGDGDFDFMMKVDRNTLVDLNKMQSVREKIAEKLSISDPGGNFREVKYKTSSGDEVEIDITFAQKTNKVGFSTDMALKQRLQIIKEQDPEKAKEVIANIIYAKQFFKSIDAYKPSHARENPQGGMGGIGVENWILNNGGSFKKAAKDFMSAAEGRDFNQFCEAYGIFDFGENHGRSGLEDNRDVTIGTTDNFIANNMNGMGYEKIKTALGEFLQNSI